MGARAWHRELRTELLTDEGDTCVYGPLKEALRGLALSVAALREVAVWLPSGGCSPGRSSALAIRGDCYGLPSGRRHV